jgi:predicted phosphodiesterase
MLALLADVHGNLEALDAVLEDIDRRAPGAHLVCAGDVVGYGPDPEACLDRLLARRATIVRGNHEEMVLGLRDDRHCVAAGILAVAWTRERLSPAARRALRALPAVAETEGAVVVCHGDLDDAGVYVSDFPRARSALARLQAARPQARILVCGHTHEAVALGRHGALGAAAPGATLEFEDAERALVNPGAVGQTRDGTVGARYALLDPTADRPRVSFVAVPYDSATTVAKLRAAGLVARVALDPPRGARRHVERVKTHAARLIVRVPALRRAWTAARTAS